MQITELLDVATRAEWRSWLAENHTRAPDIWLVTWRKHTGRPMIPYSAAVEEALCFGWIDSTRRTVDGDRYAHRYTPRRPGSGFSQTNKERLARLIERGAVHPDVLAALGDVRPEAYVMPDDILDALRAEPDAWAFFQSTSPAYQRIRVAYIDHVRKRPDDYAKRRANLVAQSARGKYIGYGIEDFY